MSSVLKHGRLALEPGHRLELELEHRLELEPGHRLALELEHKQELEHKLEQGRGIRPYGV